MIRSFITPKPGNVQNWNLDTMWVLIKALYKRCLGAPSYVTKILQAKNGQIMEILNRYISVITDIDETWFVVLSTLSTTFRLVMFVYPNMNTTFLVFFLLSYFFFFFLIFLRLFTFKPLNALYSKFERLKISGRSSAGMKLGVPSWGISLNRALQNFELLNR